MKNNTKGFTLIELFAVILIASTILMPLLSGYINNFTASNRMHDRKAASSIAMSTVEAFDKIYYENLRTMVFEDPDHTLQVGGVDGYEWLIRVTGEDCASFDQNSDAMLSGANSEDVCEYIFDFTFANIAFESDEFEVYVYPYTLTEAEHDSIEDDSMLNGDSIPQSVRDEIGFVPESDDGLDTTSIVRVTARLVYDSERGDDYVISGVVSYGYDQEEVVDEDSGDDS